LHEGLEFGTHAGLGLIEGQVKSISAKEGEPDQNFKIPHIGWSKLTPGLASHSDSWYTPPLFGGVREKWFYFVHSFSAVPNEAENIAAHVDYLGEKITAAIAKENIFGTQFHPEKSGVDGLELLSQFLES
jgi:glutamine amidotransferase